MKYLLDTDTCVFALRGNASLRERLDVTDPEEIAISVVTLAELRYGAACSAKPDANHRVIDDFITGILVLGLDTEIARVFGELKSKLRRRGTLIDDFDLLIASTAHRHGMTVITHNLDHFDRVGELPAEDWMST